MSVATESLNPWLREEPFEELIEQEDIVYESQPSVYFIKTETRPESQLHQRSSRLGNYHLLRGKLLELVDDYNQSSFKRISPQQLKYIKHKVWSEHLDSPDPLTRKSTHLQPIVVQSGITLAEHPKQFTLVSTVNEEKNANFQVQEDELYMSQQAELFESLKDKLLGKYKNKYVLFEDGEVLDVGNNRAEVAIRAYKKYGMKPLFIEKLSSEPETPPAVWTPFQKV